MKTRFTGFITCPHHDDKTASLAKYEDGSAYCFSCSLYYPPSTFDVDRSTLSPVPTEDIGARIRHIKELPTQEHRGLTFHYDSTGYYILWPDDSYYKCRKWVPDPSKYKNPRGISQPGFYLTGRNAILFIVEGEINALSLKKVYPRCAVLSPGSAGNFKEKLLKNYLAEIKKYNKVIIIVDYDKAGLTALKEIKGVLNKNLIYPKIYMNSMDINEMLTKYGETKIKEELKEMGV